MTDLLFLGGAALMAGLLRGVTGFGFALAAVPLFSLVIPPLDAVLLALLLQILAAPLDLMRMRRGRAAPDLWPLCVGAMIFTPVGALLASSLSVDLLRLMIAVTVCLGLGALLSGVQIRSGPGPALATGVVAGLMGGLAAMPGPAAVTYFLGSGREKAETRAALLVFFAFAACLALLTLAVTSEVLSTRAVLRAGSLWPVMLLGTWLGTRIFDRLGDGQYRRAAIAVLAFSAAVCASRGLAGLI